VARVAATRGQGHGDLRYRFVIDVPASLSVEQDAAVDQLSKGDERQPARGPLPGSRATAKAAEH